MGILYDGKGVSLTLSFHSPQPTRKALGSHPLIATSSSVEGLHQHLNPDPKLHRDIWGSQDSVDFNSGATKHSNTSFQPPAWDRRYVLQYVGSLEVPQPGKKPLALDKELERLEDLQQMSIQVGPRETRICSDSSWMDEQNKPVVAKGDNEDSEKKMVLQMFHSDSERSLSSMNEDSIKSDQSKGSSSEGENPTLSGNVSEIDDNGRTVETGRNSQSDDIPLLEQPGLPEPLKQEELSLSDACPTGNSVLVKSNSLGALESECPLFDCSEDADRPLSPFPLVRMQVRDTGFVITSLQNQKSLVNASIKDIACCAQVSESCDVM